MNPNFKDNIILLAEVIVPEMYQNTSLKDTFIKNFKQMFYGLEEDSSIKIKLLVQVIEKMSYVYHFKSFSNLSFDKRKKYIDKLFNFPIGKIVAGLTGLRSLILISYYSIEQVWPSIHYDGPVNSQVS